MSTLTVSNSADFTGRPLLFIDTIEFTAAATAIFGGWQFGIGKISPDVLIDGSSGTDAIVINCNVLGFDASGWQFSGWSPTSTITINGTSGADAITGSSQDDMINGGNSGDTLDGGDGNDTIVGGAGADLMSGGGGKDTLSYMGSEATVRIDLSTGFASGADATGDRFSGFENVTGGDGSDQLTGDGSNNALTGRDGDDMLSGGGGNDRLTGGDGRDTLTGGAGQDSFNYKSVGQSPPGAGRDLITDFSHAQHDAIDLSAIDAIAGGSDSAFVFIGTAAFSAPGQVRYFHDNGQTVVEADRDGDGTPDMQIALAGTLNLIAADFIL